MPSYKVAGSGTMVRRSDGQLQFLGGGAALPGDVTGAQLAEMIANGRVFDELDAAFDPTPTPDPGSTFSTAQQAALTGAYVPRWQPLTAYTAGQFVVNPSGQIVSALTGFTSGASYDAANWSAPAATGSSILVYSGTWPTRPAGTEPRIWSGPLAAGRPSDAATADLVFLYTP